jgi:outer membrane biosynthesis protein TonB
MKLFETNQEKKSLFITFSSFVLLFLLFFFLKFSDSLPLPEMEGGGGGGEIAVNFGDSDFGSGENFDSKEVVAATPKEVIETPTEEKEIVISENEEAPAIVEVKKPDSKIEKNEDDKPVVKPTPKPSKSTSDALSNLLNGTNKEGDGNDKTAGNKGKSNGDTNSKGYNGGGGKGEGLGEGDGYGRGGSVRGSENGNWKLDGRKLSSSGKQQQKCNEYGTVVVQIKVNRNGNVITAKYSKGTDNTSQCLLDAAYATAKSYKWQPDSDAAETQIGYITINFKLGQ